MLRCFLIPHDHASFLSFRTLSRYKIFCPLLVSPMVSALFMLRGKWAIADTRDRERENRPGTLRGRMKPKRGKRRQECGQRWEVIP